MKFAKASTAAILVLWLTTAPASSQSASEQQQIVDTLKAMWEALGKKDLELYASYIHPDFTAFGENDPYLASGKDLELRSYASYLRRVRGLRTEMHQPRVTIRGDVGWITYYWTEEAVNSEGERQSSRGKSTRIFVKQDGKWLCIHGHYTTVP